MGENEGPSPQFYHKFIFLMFGIAYLLAWNAILSELVFFIKYVNALNPAVSFGFLNNTPNIIIQFILLWKKDLFPLKSQLIVGIILSIIFLLAIPGFCMFLGVNSFANNFTTGVEIFVFGFVCASCQGGFFSLVGNFPLSIIVAFSTGQAISGILMNVIEYIVLFFIEGDEFGAWIFFSVSALILLICLVLLITSYK